MISEANVKHDNDLDFKSAFIKHGMGGSQTTAMWQFGGLEDYSAPGEARRRTNLSGSGSAALAGLPSRSASLNAALFRRKPAYHEVHKHLLWA